MRDDKQRVITIVHFSPSASLHYQNPLQSRDFIVCIRWFLTENVHVFTSYDKTIYSIAIRRGRVVYLEVCVAIYGCNMWVVTNHKITKTFFL